MKNEIAVSDFKAHCLEIISQLEINKKSVIITKRGEPVAKLVPLDAQNKISFLGSMKSRASIKGDLIKPIKENWSAEK